MAFKSVFIAIFIGSALIVAAFILNARRPGLGDPSLGGPFLAGQPNASFVRATGKCAACHRQETAAVVHQYEMSVHAARGVSCLDCHKAAEGQTEIAHSGFTIARHLTSANCRNCHTTEYEQYLRSRHAAPAWAAVAGPHDFTAEQIAFGEQYHAGWVDRPANALAQLEGPSAISRGCAECHDIGKPNLDGSIGTCTACHARHAASVSLARRPETCGQCHMGPDHSQLEIYHESKHGVLYNDQQHYMNLSADPKKLTTKDMSVPTCSTCHMSGLDGLKITHDTTERLSYLLFAAISDKRPTFQQGQTEMKEVCLKCHSKTPIDTFYHEAEQVVSDTNEKIRVAAEIIRGLRDDGLLTPEPFDEPIEFLYFDLWHYYGRTAKHGAFMGGADFVQWHGNYELLRKTTELQKMAEDIRAQNEAQ